MSTSNRSNPSSNTRTKDNPNLIVPGFVYIDNFLTKEESARIFQTIDSHRWSKEIKRRQQFYGPVFYFTPQSLSSTLQPVSTGVKGVRYGDDEGAASLPPDHPTQPPHHTQNDLSPPDANPNSNQPVQQTDLYAHPIEPLNWLIEKLVDHGLFERADVRDPFAEYDLDYSHNNNNNNNNNGDSDHTHSDLSQPRVPRLKRVPLPSNYRPDPNHTGTNTDPRGPDELLKANQKDSAESNNYDRKDDDLTCSPSHWGDQEFYPDQVLVNEYRENMGIGSHFDDALSFGPQIIGISLGQECTLILSRPLCCQMADTELRIRNESIERSQEDKQHSCTSSNIDNNNNNNNDDNESDPSTKKSCTKSCGDCSHNQFPQTLDRETPSQCSRSGMDPSCSIPDIEDSHPVAQKLSTKTSHNISLRDYSRPDWKVGQGPSILGKYCRCTRQQYLTQYFPNAKYLTNTPVLGADDIIAKQKELENKAELMKAGIDEESDANCDIKPISQTSPTLVPSATATTSSFPHPPTRLWQNRKMSIEEELTKYHHLPTHIQLFSDEKGVRMGNSPDSLYRETSDNDVDNQGQNLTDSRPQPTLIPLPPQTQDDIYHFLLQYDYGSLPHRKFHPRSGEDITMKEKWDEINSTLRHETEQTLDFTPSLEQFNRCTFPSDNFEYNLKPGSVYVMSGVSRYQFRHAIPKGSCVLGTGEEKGDATINAKGGETITPDPESSTDLGLENTKDQYRRVSLTIRSLLPGRRQVEHNSAKDQAEMKRKVFGKLSETKPAQ